MAKHSDVKVSLSGLTGVTPIGATITYAIGQIPTASVDLSPGSPGNIWTSGSSSGVLTNIDKEKRKEDITLDISVTSHFFNTSSRTDKLKFVGLFDGLSVGNIVGGNHYQAILKNKAQTLLEITTLTPGLFPTSVNIYKTTSFAITHEANDGPNNGGVEAWTRIINSDVVNTIKDHPIKIYTNILREIIKKQMNGWEEFVSRDLLLDNNTPFQKIFSDPRYQKALKTAEKIFKNIDYSAVTEGSFANTTNSHLFMDMLANTFAQGPNVILENYMNFLSNLGCTLIFSNNKIFVVPINSVIKQEYKAPGVRQMQSTTNHAHPADYNSYTYNDNGYRDIAHVIITTDTALGGAYLGGLTNDRGAVAHFSEAEGLSQASGVYVVAAHPWMFASPMAANSSDIPRERLDDKADAMLKPKKFKAALKDHKEKRAAKDKERTKSFEDTLQDVINNYAETKFYQVRYADRQGTITMAFNTDWTPGTSGTLYIRETGMFIAFYVTSVTHRVEMSAPSNGSATTIINFCCGRMGYEPVGVDKDKYLGYDLDKEKKIQKKFLEDIK